MKLKVYQSIIVAALLLFAGAWLGRVRIVLLSSSTATDGTPKSATILPPALSPVPQPLASVDPMPPLPRPTPSVQPQESQQPRLAASQTSKPSGSATGVLRVSNRTGHPIRVALLPKSSGQKSYAKPAHWDFAPGEGSRKGLILSLPEGKLKLKRGDILVVFAQDGSRRYWGPYVAGETTTPAWNQQVTEWQLVLQP